MSGRVASFTSEVSSTARENQVHMVLFRENQQEPSQDLCLKWLDDTDCDSAHVPGERNHLGTRRKLLQKTSVALFPESES